MPAYQIPEATGASIRPDILQKDRTFCITDFGASEAAPPVANMKAINETIRTAAEEGGGTVLFPKGIFTTYTILLRSNVNLCLEEGAVVAAAKTDIVHSYEKQSGEGGNYAEPEVNPYVGIQDHGHSYFANSLVYGADLENIMIYGKGLFTGGRFNSESGILEYVLQGGDPMEPASRTDRGHQGEWFGNKGIALVRCRNVILKDFSFTIGGHFAIIAEGCENLYAEGLLVDTTRDAFDIDCCQDVTVRRTVCNSLTDDGLCLKASFGAGIFKPLENVLIEDCTVSGYDAGSVYAGEYTRDKLVAVDRCGPTGRVKLGTESTCGYRQVTVRRVKFDRSRGFCLEAVDGSSLTDIIFEDCLLDNVSSSPIFLRAGDRCRYPVTGNSPSSEYPAPAGNSVLPEHLTSAGKVEASEHLAYAGNVRLDNLAWVLPNDENFHCYPARRYAPHYNRTKSVTVDGHSFFEIVDGDNPVQCNPANYEERDGHYYLKMWKSGEKTSQEIAPEKNTPQKNALQKTIPRETALEKDTPQSQPLQPGRHLAGQKGSYETDFSRELEARDLPLYANGIGCPDMAVVANVLIRNVTVTNADPRYPILLMGLTDSHIKNVTLEHISVEYRGGLTMEHAVEQRQLNTDWKYSQFHAREHVQSLPWLVNSFFSKNEGLLPRVDWNSEHACWKEDPYNVPELPEIYPEPSNWGILPAYGLFAKHVDGLTLRDVCFSCKVSDSRHVCVFDDVNDVCLDGFEAFCEKETVPIAAVTSHYRRHTNAENVPEQPYFTTTVKNLEITRPLILHDTPSCHGQINDNLFSGSRNQWVKSVTIDAPAPGTPQDSLYSCPTVPCAESGYRFGVDTEDYPLPLTVYRPFIQPVAPVHIPVGDAFSVILTARNPASDISEEADSGIIYNEKAARPNYGVKGMKVPLTLSCENLPENAVFDMTSRDCPDSGSSPVSGCFHWTPATGQEGEYDIVFAVDDGVLPEKMVLHITVHS